MNSTDLFAALIRSTTFLSIAACVAVTGIWMLRMRSHRITSTIWTMVLLAGLLVMPARLDVPWYPTAESLAKKDDTTLPIGDVAATEWTVAPVGPSITSTMQPLRSPSGHQAGASSADSTEKPPPPPLSAAEKPSLAPWGIRTFATVWFWGFAVIAGLATLSYCGLIGSLRGCWRPHAHWQREYDRVANEMGVESPPRMQVHGKLGPLLCLTPTGHRLVVPTEHWGNLRREQREIILRHELAHFVRNDVWRTLPARLIVLVHWFNPLAWMAARQVEESAEWAADRLALRDQPERTGDLAAALVDLAQHTQPSRLFVSAASGLSFRRSGTLRKRLQNLIQLSEPKGDESMMRRVALVVVMGIVLLPGAVQIRLVAQENRSADPAESSESESTSSQETASTNPAADGVAAGGAGTATDDNNSVRARVSIDSAKAFAESLRGDDELTELLKQALATEQGALVLRDRAGHYQTMAREDARANAIPRFFEETFEYDPAGDELVLADDNDPFRQQFLASAETLNKEIEEIKNAMSERADQMSVKSDLDKLLHRFLTHESAPIIFYARQIRPRMGAGMQSLERVFASQLARRADGRFEIRPDAKARLEERIRVYDERAKFVVRLQKDFADFAEDIAPTDDLHRRIKAAFSDPIGGTQMGLTILDREENPRQYAMRIISQYDGAFKEGPDGLILREGIDENIKRVVTGLERMVGSGESIRSPLKQFVDRISDHDELHVRLKEVMSSDITLARTAAQVQYIPSNIQAAVKMYFASFLVENDEGELHVSTDNVTEEQIVGLVSSILREARIAKRNGREATAWTMLVQDETLRTAMLTPGGKVAIGDALQAQLSRDVPDGFDRWVKDHFESDEDGYRIRPEHRDAMQKVVQQIQEVTRELENADF